MNVDVIVIGLGAIGSATLHQLAKRGVKALGIDRFTPPHDKGSSHGETRVTRLAIGEGEAYAPLVRKSHATWRELEAETGESLLLSCGFLAVDSAGGVTEFHGKTGFMERTVGIARQFGIRHETFSGDEARHRFPGFVFTGAERCYHEPDGGLVFPERCIAAQLTMAERLGATVTVGERVGRIRTSPKGVEVVTDKGRHLAGHAVVTAGGWSAEFAPKAMRRTRLLRQVLYWFEAENPALWNADRSPTFIWTHGPKPENSFYGFPIVAGARNHGVKVATEQYSHVSATPDAVHRDVGADEVRAMFDDHVARFMRGVGPTALHKAVCFYTFTPDGDFLIGPVEDQRNVTLVSACSGHGFKHSAGVGALIADHLLDGVPIPTGFAPYRFPETPQDGTLHGDPGQSNGVMA